MASELKNLKRRLSWSDFKPDPSVTAPLPGKTVTLAGTASDFSAGFSGRSQASFPAVPGSKPKTYMLADDVTVTATMDQKKSWVAGWITQLSAGDPISQFLLDHEQGHYSISALLARDCFIELMGMKMTPFTSAPSGQGVVQAKISGFKTLLNQIQVKYDWETSHGAWTQLSIGPPSKSADQIRWEGFFQTAFTKERTPRVLAPDGVAYKVPLLDVLLQAGITIP